MEISPQFEQNNKIFKNGQRVLAEIADTKVIGVITHYDYRWYLLHNNPDKNGSQPSDMKGFKYSWTFDLYEYSDVKVIDYADDYKDLSITKSFEKFLNKRIDISHLNKVVVMKNLSTILPLVDRKPDGSHSINKSINYGLTIYILCF